VIEFYLGAHEPSWLRRAGVPLMVSHIRLSRPKAGRLRRATVPWVLDSGGFSELSMRGRWTISPAAYIEAVEQYQTEIGRMVWCAPQDWMCEPFIVAKTGLSVAEHQERTIVSFLELRAAGLPVIPVLQGFAPDDYHRHLAQYTDAGVELAQLATVGLGSVCRRQASADIEALVRSLAPLRLHGFGVKTAGLARYAAHLTSADSMAWSLDGRRTRPCPRKQIMNCANCLHHALAWRDRALEVAA
jgi:hypothetical protein